MAMAAMQRIPVLQQNLSSRPSVVNDIRNSRSNSRRSSSSGAFGSGVVTIRGSCIWWASLATRSRIPGRCGRSWLAKAEGGGGGGGGGDGAQEEKGENNSATSVASPGEPTKQLSSAMKGFGPPPKVVQDKKKSSSKSSSGSVRRAPPSKPLIGASLADQQAQQLETAVVGSLAFLFAVIFLEGLLLAASGFLPEEWDEFAVNSVYPAFTPTVGVFLTVAASYGLWKTLGGGTGQSSR